MKYYINAPSEIRIQKDRGLHSSQRSMTVAILAIILYTILPSINGHGRLIEPPSRASAWRYGFDTPHNYNDHELYCGGYTRQWVKNGGKCGVCGDPWDSKIPRAHEFGGTYGQGVVVRKYNVGSIINIRVELTANHNGYFMFALCSNYKNTTQDCLDKNILKIMKPQDSSRYSDVRYYPKEGNKVYEMKYRLPKISCPHCVLQWRYIAGNNWGTCPNGTEQVGCGPQEEFRGCSDITIGKGIVIETTTEPETTITPDITLPEPEESYNPISAIIITLVSFLIAFLIFFLLYFHYYHIGEKLKNWIKTRSESKNEKNFNNFPKAPPRVRRPSRNGSNPHDNFKDVSLNF